MKKLASLLLALVMIMSCIPAMAAMEGELTGGSITINDAIPGQVYKAYQILYLESYSDPNPDNPDDGAYAYKANSAWADWLKTMTDYVSIDDQGYVTWVEGADAAKFAKAAQEQLAGKNSDGTATALPENGTVDSTTPSTTVTIKDLKLGYYLVDTTLGTLCSLDTTNPDVIMKEKNEAPSITKEVAEDSNGEYGDTNDADMSQTVNFKATITVQAGAENYVMHDTMDAGLTYTGVTSVKIGNTEVDNTKYTVTAPGTSCDGCTFEVAFNDEYIATLDAGTEIVVSYSAILNGDAEVGLAGNKNSVQLEYGDENNSTFTPSDETITYTWDMDVLKYANNDKAVVLKDAQFVLLNNDKTKVATIVDGKVTGWVAIPAAVEGVITWPENTVQTTDENGSISIDGLDADTYYLRETKAPDGYNKLASDVEVVVTGATTPDGSTELTYSTVVAEVNNQSGTELPSTGGMGTTILYVGGGILVLAAIVLLIAKRRTAA